MGRDLAAGRPTGRVLAGRAILLATGMGTVMTAGAGLASAAPLDNGSTAAPSAASASPASSLPAGSVASGGTATPAASPSSPVSGTDLVGGLLAGGSGGDHAADSKAADSKASDGTAAYDTSPASQESPDPDESGAPTTPKAGKTT